MKRLNFVVQDEVYERLEALKEKTQATSLAEVFRDSLRAYAWMVSQFELGRQVVSRPVDPNATEESYGGGMILKAMKKELVADLVKELGKGGVTVRVGQEYLKDKS